MRFQVPAALSALFLLTSAAGAQTAGVGIESNPSQPVKLVRVVKPAYPPEAKAAKISGKVRLAATVGKDGKVQELKITSGHPLLGAAARYAVRQWEYEPLAVDGQPVDFRVDIDLDFTLSADGPAPLRVPGNVQQGKVVNLVRPVYPPEAKQEHIQGKVWLRAVITREGAVESVYVQEGDPALAAAAVDGVKQWQYSPTLLNGEPVPVITDIDVNFTLSPQ